MKAVGQAKTIGAVLGVCLLAASALIAGCQSSPANSASSTSASAAATTASTGAAPGAPGAPPGGAGGGGGSSTAVMPTSAALIVNGQSKTVAGQTYTASNKDQSAILVENGGKLTATNVTLKTTGNTSSSDSSSFYGLNAGAVATANSSLTMSNSSITTSGSGANGAFATGKGAVVNLTNVTIKATGGGGHGVMATQGGTVTLTGCKFDTAGGSSAPLATDRGGGTITATNCTAVCSGSNSPAIYSTGVITVNGGTYKATGSEAAVIEGGNSIILNNVALSSTYANKWGVMIYQSMSGDAAGTKGTYTATGGSLSLNGAKGPLFYVNNSTAVINLKGVKVSVASGILVKAAAGNWGTSGSNGGTVIFTGDAQSLTGNLVADKISSISLTLKNGSSLTGTINGEKTAKSISLTLDSTSKWNVTGDSYLTTLTLSGGISGSTISRIVGNGHTVYYDSTNSANSTLGGKTYQLAGGGTLKPMS